MSPAFDSSRYALDLTFEPLVYRGARIELRTNTSRIMEALTHELLHLSLIMGAHPCPGAFAPGRFTEQHIDFVVEVTPKLMNLVDHEAMIDVFLELDYAKERFLGEASPGKDYNKVAGLSLLQGTEPFSFTWWCSEYFRHWMGARQGQPKLSQRLADEALRHGLRVHPELKEVVRRLHGWAEKGDSKNPRTYRQSVERLFTIMRMPLPSNWYFLRLSDHGIPEVVWLNEKPTVAQAGS